MRTLTAMTVVFSADDPTQVLSDSTLEQPLADGLSLSGTQLTWTIPEIPVGGTVRVSYQATVCRTWTAW